MTKTERILDVVRAYVFAKGKGPEAAHVAKVTGIPTKDVGAFLANLRNKGRVTYKTRDWSTLRVVESREQTSKRGPSASTRATRTPAPNREKPAPAARGVERRRSGHRGKSSKTVVEAAVPAAPPPIAASDRALILSAEDFVALESALASVASIVARAKTAPSLGAHLQTLVGQLSFAPSVAAVPPVGEAIERQTRRRRRRAEAAEEASPSPTAPKGGFERWLEKKRAREAATGAASRVRVAEPNPNPNPPEDDGPIEETSADESARFQVITAQGEVLGAFGDMDSALRCFRRSPNAWNVRRAADGKMMMAGRPEAATG